MAALAGPVGLGIGAALMLQQQMGNVGSKFGQLAGDGIKGIMGERAGGKAVESVGNIAGAMKPVSPGEVLGKTMQYGPLAGPMMAIERLEQLGKGIVGMPQAVLAWGEELKESRRHLASFNGTIAAAYAGSEMRDLMRNVQSARSTSGSTAAMIDAFDDLKDELRPIKDATITGINTLAVLLARLVETGTWLAKEATPLFAASQLAATWLEGKMGRPDVAVNPGLEALNWLQNAEIRRNARRRAEGIDE
jgi:hypothetical protein